MDTQSEYLIIMAFRRWQWLRERTSMLRFMYITCFVFFSHTESLLQRPTANTV